MTKNVAAHPRFAWSALEKMMWHSVTKILLCLALIAACGCYMYRSEEHRQEEQTKYRLSCLAAMGRLAVRDGFDLSQIHSLGEFCKLAVSRGYMLKSDFDAHTFERDGWGGEMQWQVVSSGATSYEIRIRSIVPKTVPGYDSQNWVETIRPK
jgi:hypothetical protein